MKYCSVIKCQINGCTIDVRINYVLEEWKNLNCWKISPYLICSRHFTHNSYSKSKKKLKKSAKPTLFLPRPASVTSTQILAEHNYASPDIKLLKRGNKMFDMYQISNKTKYCFLN